MNPVSFRQLIDWPNVWVYLSGNPLFALFVTLLVYQFGVWCAERCGRHPLVNPTLIAVVLLASALKLVNVSTDWTLALCAVWVAANLAAAARRWRTSTPHSIVADHAAGENVAAALF